MTTQTIQPYLFFNGRCEEALEYYRIALGAVIEAKMLFKENPDGNCGGEGNSGPAPDPDKIMHSSFRIGDSTVMASDGMCSGPASFEGFSLSINITDEAEARRIWAALEQGGEVQMPMSPTFFSPLFGMVQDKFGVSWMIHVAPSAAS